MAKKKSAKTLLERWKWQRVSKKILDHKEFLGLLCLVVLVGLVYGVVHFRAIKAEPSPTPTASLTHLIASLSAQPEPIKIDPYFSYNQAQLKKEPPVKLVIPSVNIDVPVVEAPIVDGFWQTSTDSASFGLGSAYPSQTGNTVIFAHARPGLFADLRLVKPESSVYLFTPSGWYEYRVEEVKTVLPDQIEVVSPTEDDRLTLYTCSGWRDVYRLVVIAPAVRKG